MVNEYSFNPLHLMTTYKFSLLSQILKQAGLFLFVVMITMTIIVHNIV